MRLGLNIDHVATLREARKTTEPDLLRAALIAEKKGVDQITVHLRSDRRHIQDQDLEVLKANIKIPLNVEMSTSNEMLEIAAKIKPNKITLVPERVNEVTTEGGLDLLKQGFTVESFCKHLSQTSPATVVSVFIDPCEKQLNQCNLLGIKEIEINTASYAEASDLEEIQAELKRISDVSKIASNLKMEVAAGHGLKESNIPAILKIKEIQELNIGHHIIADSIFLGLDVKILKILSLLRNSK